MKQSDLCKVFGLSKGQVSKLVQRGMPTRSVEDAEAWRRRHLDPAMVASHQARKRLQHNTPADTRNPVDAIVCGILPQLLLDRLELLSVMVDAGLSPDPEALDAFGAGLAGHLHRVLFDQLGLPRQELNLPAWLSEVPE